MSGVEEAEVSPQHLLKANQKSKMATKTNTKLAITLL